MAFTIPPPQKEAKHCHGTEERRGEEGYFCLVSKGGLVLK
jgi:hypothetical protein